MNNINESAYKLKEALLEDERIKEYFRLKEIVNNDKDLIEIRDNLKRLQKEHKKEEYLILKDKYLSHPVVRNYDYIKEEVKELIDQLLEILDI